MIPFIVGVGRSGTTLLRMMLDAHPQLAIPPETGFIPALSPAPSSAEAFVDILRSAPTWPDLHVDADVVASRLRTRPFDVADALSEVYRTYAARFAKPRWGDKTPLYCLHMTAIQALFPSACFIHVIRDGRDVAASVRGLWFAPGSDISDIARDWHDRIVAARAQAKGLRRYVEVHYEDLVNRPREVLEGLCTTLELAFDDAMLRYHERSHERLSEHLTRYNADGSVLITHEQRVHNQRFTMQPPTAERIAVWRDALSVSEHASFVAVAGQLLASLGYDLTP